MAEIPNAHIQQIILWDYHCGMHPLTSEQMMHLAHCNQCLATLGLCQISNSLQEVELRLRPAR
jgi:hypothetical protein